MGNPLSGLFGPSRRRDNPTDPGSPQNVAKASAPLDESAAYFKELARQGLERRIRQSGGRTAAFAPGYGTKTTTGA